MDLSIGRIGIVKNVVSASNRGVPTRGYLDETEVLGP